MAPTFEKLFDFQSNVEAELAAYFQANGLRAFETRSTVDLPDARVIVMVEIGTAHGHKTPGASSGTGANEEDWFNLVIKFQIQTERELSGGFPLTEFSNLHDYLVARVRVLMLWGSLRGTLGNATALDLPFYNLAVLTFAGATDAIADGGLDVTELTYSAQIQILASAWPQP